MNLENKRIYLSPPHMSGNEIKYIKEAFEQNWIAPLGPNVDALESSLATYCGVKYAAVLSSGTAAIHLALILLGVKQGDEVIASTFTFSATINPIIYQSATPLLVDCEKDTWNMDPDILEHVIKERLKSKKRPCAIIPVHLYGMPAKMSEIMSVADYYEIPIIEDAAEALGSRYANKPLGSLGKMSVLSFNGNKIITTSGGGAILSNDEELIVRARFLATQARDKAIYYQHSQIGYNYRMSNIIAGVGRGQMEVVNERVNKRRDNYLFYRNSLSGIKGISFQEEPDENYFSNHWLTTLVIDPLISGITPEIIQRELENENIETRQLWKPMHLQPVFSSCPAYVNGTSENLFKRGLCLPSGSSLSENDRQRIVNIVKQCIHCAC
jgi:dTDP-4-amino-4,6-dideoxygalactose transaminase